MSVMDGGMALNAINSLDTRVLTQTLIARRYFKLSLSSIERLITHRGGGDAFLSLYITLIFIILCRYTTFHHDGVAAKGKTVIAETQERI